MSNIAIYYSMNELESSEEVIDQIEKLIQEINGNLKGVYIDTQNSSENFNLLTGEDLNSLDILYLNQEPSNDFDDQLIKELSKAADFQIIYFHKK